MKKMTYKDFIKNSIDDKEKMELIKGLIIYSYVFQQPLEKVLTMKVHERTLLKGKCKCDKGD